MEQLLFDLTSGLLDREDYEYLKRKYTEEMNFLKQREKQVKEQVLQLDRALEATRKWLAALKNISMLFGNHPRSDGNVCRED